MEIRLTSKSFRVYSLYGVKYTYIHTYVGGFFQSIQNTIDECITRKDGVWWIMLKRHRPDLRYWWCTSMQYWW